MDYAALKICFFDDIAEMLFDATVSDLITVLSSVCTGTLQVCAITRTSLLLANFQSFLRNPVVIGSQLGNGVSKVADSSLCDQDDIPSIEESANMQEDFSNQRLNTLHLVQDIVSDINLPPISAHLVLNRVSSSFSLANTASGSHWH